MASSLMRQVLVLGSGKTCPPLVELLTRGGDTAVTIASNDRYQAQQIASKCQNTQTAPLDVTSTTKLSSLIGQHQLVVSLVPNIYHPAIAKQCISHSVNLVTASYVSPEMAALDQPARDAGITLMNEIGLDPGVDHMLAMACIDDAHSKGGKVMSFESWVGGLPHPLFTNNPLKYKFSWSPRGVFVASQNGAKYLKDGKVVEIPVGKAIESVEPKDLFSGFPLPLEGYPNRNSLSYKEVYGIPEAKTILRGTLRYKGFCRVVSALRSLGLLSMEQHQRLGAEAAALTWRDLMTVLISQTDISQPDLRSSVLAALNGDNDNLLAIEELGLLSDAPVQLLGSPLEALAAHLGDKLQLGEKEYDTILLQHKVGIEWPDKSTEEHCISLHVNGEPGGHTAMSKLVGKPAAIAANMILSGELQLKGVVRPVTKQVYEPLLRKLKDEGMEYTVKVTK